MTNSELFRERFGKLLLYGLGSLNEKHAALNLAHGVKKGE